MTTGRFESATGFEGPLAEFAALRQELEGLSGTYQNTFALQLSAAGAIFSFALTGSGSCRFC